MNEVFQSSSCGGSRGLWGVSKELHGYRISGAHLRYGASTCLVVVLPGARSPGGGEYGSMCDVGTSSSQLGRS